MIEREAFRYLVYTAKFKGVAKDVWKIATKYQRQASRDGQFYWSPCYKTLAGMIACSTKQISRLFQKFVAAGFVTKVGKHHIYHCTIWRIDWFKICDLAEVEERREIARRNRRLERSAKLAVARTPPNGLDMMSIKTPEELWRKKEANGISGSPLEPLVEAAPRLRLSALSQKDLEGGSEPELDPNDWDGDEYLNSSNSTPPDSAASRPETFQVSSDQPELHDSAESKQGVVNHVQRRTNPSKTETITIFSPCDQYGTTTPCSNIPQEAAPPTTQATFSDSSGGRQSELVSESFRRRVRQLAAQFQEPSSDLVRHSKHPPLRYTTQSQTIPDPDRKFQLPPRIARIRASGSDPAKLRAELAAKSNKGITP